MRTITATWHETKIRAIRVTEDGANKKVKESYIVCADSCAEAETRIVDELALQTTEIEVTGTKKTTYNEIIFSDNGNDLCSYFYLAKLRYITLDEKSGKEKKTTVPYLVQGSTPQGAIKTVEAAMGGSTLDWDIASIAETNILDVYEMIPEKTKANE